MEPLTYSNPRMRAVIENWPSGSKRVTAQFQIEQSKRGERALRQTTGATKALTYARMARIVDGSDGRTYIAELTSCGFISIMRGDMKFQQESIFQNDPRYPTVFELFAADAPDDPHEAAEKAEEIRRQTAEDVGLRTAICPKCGAFNPYSIWQPKPTKCEQCGASLDEGQPNDR